MYTDLKPIFAAITGSNIESDSLSTQASKILSSCNGEEAEFDLGGGGFQNGTVIFDYNNLKAIFNSVISSSTTARDDTGAINVNVSGTLANNACLPITHFHEDLMAASQRYVVTYEWVTKQTIGDRKIPFLIPYGIDANHISLSQRYYDMNVIYIDKDWTYKKGRIRVPLYSYTTTSGTYYTSCPFDSRVIFLDENPDLYNWCYNPSSGNMFCNAVMWVGTRTDSSCVISGSSSNYSRFTYMSSRTPEKGSFYGYYPQYLTNGETIWGFQNPNGNTRYIGTYNYLNIIGS